MDFQFLTPILVDTGICVLLDQPNLQNLFKIFRLENQLLKIVFQGLTHFSKVSPRDENPPPSVDSHDVRLSISTISQVAISARLHLKCPENYLKISKK